MLKSAPERVLSFVDQLLDETVVEQRCIPMRHDVLRLRLGSPRTPLWQRCKIDGLWHGLASQHWLPFAVLVAAFRVVALLQWPSCAYLPVL